MDPKIDDFIAAEKKQRIRDIIVGITFVVLAITALIFKFGIATLLCSMAAGISFGKVIMRARIIMYMNMLAVQEAVVEFLLAVRGFEVGESGTVRKIRESAQSTIDDASLNSVTSKKDQKN